MGSPSVFLLGFPFLFFIKHNQNIYILLLILVLFDMLSSLANDCFHMFICQ